MSKEEMQFQNGKSQWISRGILGRGERRQLPITECPGQMPRSGRAYKREQGHVRSHDFQPCLCGARQFTAALVLVAYAKERSACHASHRAGLSNPPSVLQPVLSVSPSVVPDSLRLHGLQPTRLLCPWDFQARILEWVAVSFSIAACVMMTYSNLVLKDVRTPPQACGGRVSRLRLG